MCRPVAEDADASADEGTGVDNREEATDVKTCSGERCVSFECEVTGGSTIEVTRWESESVAGGKAVGYRGEVKALYASSSVVNSSKML